MRDGRWIVTTTVLTFLALAGSVLAADARVKLLMGDGPTGEVVSLSTERITLRTSAGEKSIPAAELMWLELPAQTSDIKATAWAELLDGSRLNLVGYSTSGGQAQLELTSGQTAKVPARAVKWVRFRPQDPELATQWREILAGQATGDLLVVRKTSTRTVTEDDNETTVTEVALDQLDGTILDVGGESIQFEFDGEKIDVRREKLEGIVYYQATRREFSPPACRLVDSGGSAWSLKSLELADGRIRGSAVGGAAIDFPLSAVAKIDYSVGNVFFLADLEPDTGAGDPVVSLQPAAMSFKFGRVFGVRSGPPLGATHFQIGGKRYDGGISLHSPASIVYRVPEGVRWLRAEAGVDDSVVVPGHFDLVVLGDGKELFRHTFQGADERGPVPLDLDVSGVRRITIVLDPADGLDIGDQLDLCDARMTK
jgi:hypothetical protein